jgi:hypothetical protein
MWRDGGDGERLRPTNIPQILYLSSFASFGKSELRKAGKRACGLERRRGREFGG